MEQPEGFKISSSNKVYCLLHTLHGLKQATLAWNKELHKSLLQLGFKRSKADPGVYYYQDKSGIVLFIVYVDDGLLMSNSSTLLKKKKTAFLKIWEAREMGPVSEYLGFQIIRDRSKQTMVLHQHPYVQKVLKHFELHQEIHKILILLFTYYFQLFLTISTFLTCSTIYYQLKVEIVEIVYYS